MARTSTIPLAIARYYLRGREDAVADYDVSDVDLGGLAREIARGADMHAACEAPPKVDLAGDERDGTKARWLADEDAGCQGAGIAPEDAWRAWCRGYVDVAADLLEKEVVNHLWELVETEDDATTSPATPIAKAHANPATPRGAGAAPVDGGGSYAAWYADGGSDAVNGWDKDALDAELDQAFEDYKTRPSFGASRRAQEAIDAYWQEIGDEMEATWMANHRKHARADGLDPRKAYKAWEDGYRAACVRMATEVLLERARAAGL